MTSGWTIAKDTVGFIGACAASIPWFRDFIARTRRQWISKLPIHNSLQSLHEELEESVETWLARPKMSDLALMVGGLLLVALSFLIGLMQSLIA